MRLAFSLLLLGCAGAPSVPDGGACYLDPAEPGDYFTVWRDDRDAGHEQTICHPYLIDCFTTLGCSHGLPADGGRFHDDR